MLTNPDLTLLELVKNSDNPAEIVRLITEQGAVYNVIDDDGYTPLAYAVKNNYIENVRVLLEYGSDPNAPVIIGKHGFCSNVLLIHSIINNNTEIAKLLIKANANTEIADTNRLMAITTAAQNGNLDVILDLIKAGANLDASTSGGWSALMIAAYNGHKSVVEALIAAGANVEQENKNGLTALMLAAKNGYINVIQVLLEAKNKNGFTALMLAAKDGNLNLTSAF